MHARGIDSLALDGYQRAARVVLANHLITRQYPDRIALPLVRRWATELREDLAELFGYRLEVTETTARLFPVLDRLESGRPGRTTADRLFDRRRYAYLALALAALGRAGDQITLSELADQVASYTERVDGLDLAADRAADRDAFVDAVGWLAARGAVTLADGDAGGWASDPEAGEALYDIDRSVVFALFRPPRALQHLHSVTGLLGEEAGGKDTRSPAQSLAARKVRRALVEQPVVYADDFAEPHRTMLAQEKLVAEVELITGLRAERRAEGVALIDSSGRLSDVRFPGTGTLAQVALLLAGEIADLVLDIDNPVFRMPRPERPLTDLVEQLDSAIPRSSVFAPLADPVDIFGPDEDPADPEDVAEPEIPEFPFVASEWIGDTVRMLTHRYGATFAAQWQADVPGLTAEAVSLLERLRLVEPIGTGLLVLPALARYRGAIVTIRSRAETELFSSATELGTPAAGEPVRDADGDDRPDSADGDGTSSANVADPVATVESATEVVAPGAGPTEHDVSDLSADRDLSSATAPPEGGGGAAASAGDTVATIESVADAVESVAGADESATGADESVTGDTVPGAGPTENDVSDLSAVGDLPSDAVEPDPSTAAGHGETDRPAARADDPATRDMSGGTRPPDAAGPNPAAGDDMPGAGRGGDSPRDEAGSGSPGDREPAADTAAGPERRGDMQTADFIEKGSGD